MSLDLSRTLPDDADDALLIGRLWQPGVGPTVVACHDGMLLDLSRLRATVSQLLELPNVVVAAQAALAAATPLAPLASVLANSDEGNRDESHPWVLAPCDLQVVKASGVNFVASLLERVIV